MPIPNKFVVLDLEMNTEGPSNPTTEIIQIGACIADCETKQIIDSFTVFVKPTMQPLSEYITGLTGITQQQVDDGVTLLEAYRALASWISLHKDERLNYSVVTWGGGDAEYLKTQLDHYYAGALGEIAWPFAKTHFDVKKIYQTYRMANGKTMPSGLAKSLTKMGLRFQGKIHNAQSDSENTAYMLFALLDKMKDE